MVRARDRSPALGRRGPSRDPKHRLLLVCEGTKTEPLYFKYLQHAFRNRLVQVEISGEGKASVTLVKRALELRDEAERAARAQRDDNLRFDEVWCVCDVDEHRHLDQALELAAANGIRVALSNPCFELWALLHFQLQSKAIHRHDAQRLVKELLGVKEDKLLPLDRLHHGYADAVRRAQSLRKTAHGVGQPRRNPSTNVDELTEQIRRFGQP